VSWHKSEAVKCLLELGAQIDAIDKNGKSGVFLATTLNVVDILEVLYSVVCVHVHGGGMSSI